MVINIKMMISWVVITGINILEYRVPPRYWNLPNYMASSPRRLFLLLELLHYDIYTYIPKLTLMREDVRSYILCKDHSQALAVFKMCLYITS
jgi:hypothetical protein